MKIVVTTKQVPDPNASPALEQDFSLSRDRDAVLDPGDECGVEVGLQLQEAHGGEVLLVSMGTDRARDAIRKGLSMGADRAALVTDPALQGADALMTARVLAAVISKESPDLVICSTESYDGSSGLVPAMLAELLNRPQLTFAKRVEARPVEVIVERQTSWGHEVVRSPLPALVTVTAGIAEPRYASLRGIMAARSKEIAELTLADLGLEPEEPVEEILRVTDAPPRAAGEIVEGDGEAVVERILAALDGAKVL